MSEQAIGRSGLTFTGAETGVSPARIKSLLSRKHLALAGAALLAAGAAWYGEEYWSVGRFIETTDDAYVGGDVTNLAPRVSGLIAEVLVRDNQHVHAGDLLVKIDDRDYRAALAKADAAVAGDQATLANLDATHQLQLSLIDQARAGIASVQAETTRAGYDETRYRQLTTEGAASTQSFERADASYKQALANGAHARDGLDAAQAQLAVIAAQRQQAEASLAAAIADRDEARLNLGYTEIRAPIDGIIGNRAAEAGGFASIGSQLVSLVPAQGLWIDANFKESQLARMQPGDKVTIEADALPGVKLQGHVLSLAPATGAQFSLLPAENATGNFTKIVQRVPVRIQLDGDPATLGRLRPGLSVLADVDTRDAP